MCIFKDKTRKFCKNIRYWRCLQHLPQPVLSSTTGTFFMPLLLLRYLVFHALVHLRTFSSPLFRMWALYWLIFPPNGAKFNLIIKIAAINLFTSLSSRSICRCSRMTSSSSVQIQMTCALRQRLSSCVTKLLNAIVIARLYCGNARFRCCHRLSLVNTIGNGSFLWILLILLVKHGYSTGNYCHLKCWLLVKEKKYVALQQFRYISERFNWKLH